MPRVLRLGAVIAVLSGLGVLAVLLLTSQIYVPSGAIPTFEWPAQKAPSDAGEPFYPDDEEEDEAVDELSSRISSLLGDYVADHDNTDMTASEWRQVVEQREAAFEWCVGQVSRQEDVSIAAATEIVGAAITSFDREAVVVVLNSIESAESDLTRRRQCAALLYLADPATQ